jgi:hypothetical protein
MRRSQVLWVLLLILLLLRLVLFSVLLDGGAEADLSLSQAEVRGMSLWCWIDQNQWLLKNP